MLYLKMLHHKLKVNMSDFDKQANDSMAHHYGGIYPPSEDKDKPIELFQTEEFVKVCEVLGLLEPTINEINEDMWTLQQQTELNDRRW